MMRGPVSAALLSLLTVLPAQRRSGEDFDLALGLVRRGMHEEAAQHFESFLRSAPKGPRRLEAQYRLGVSQVELKRLAAAVRAFRSALSEAGRSAFPLRAECRYRLGLVLEQSGEGPAAAKQFETLVAEVGEGHYLAAAALHAAGECHRAAGKRDAALRCYTRAGKLRGKEHAEHAAAALYQAGFLHLHAGEFRQAEQQFAEAAGRFPKHPAHGECRYLEGESALRGRRYKAAARAFSRAQQLKGDFADDARFGLASCYQQQGRGDDAIEVYAELCQRHPDSPLRLRAQLEIGRLHHEAGRQKSAATVLQATAEDRAVSQAIKAQAYELWGLVHLAQKQAKPAARRLQTALDLYAKAPDKSRVAYSLAEAQADAGDWQAARAAYQKSAATAADAALKGDARYGEILALHRLGKFDASNQQAQGFLREQPKHRLVEAVRFAIAENHFAREDYAAAAEAYESLPSESDFAAKAAFKAAWCAYLGKAKARAAQRFAQVARTHKSREPELAEEAAAMVAMAEFEAGSIQAALQAADSYKRAYPRGRFLARSERIAARVLRKQGKLKAAASRLAMAAAKEGSAERAGADQLEYAELQFQQGDFDAAQKAYTELAGRPDAVGAQALEGLAWCAFELGEDQACSEAIAKALGHGKLGDRRAGVLELASALQHRRQDWPAAQRAARRFLEECPGHPREQELRYALGVAQARAGAHAAAVKTFGAVRPEQLKRPDRLHYEWAWAHKRGAQAKQALAAFARVVAVSKDVELKGEALLHLGEAQLAAGKAAPALAQLLQVKGKHEARARYLCGYHHFEAGRFPQAEQQFIHLLGLDSAGDLRPEAQFFAGTCAARAGRHAQALPRFAALLKNSPDHPRAQAARLQYGQSLLHEKQHAAAQAQLAAYLRGLDAKGKRSDDAARAHLALGQAAMAQQRLEVARRAFSEVTNLVENDLAAAAQWHLGRCHKAQGQTKDAASAYVKLSILYGHPEWVAKGLLAAGNCYLELKQPAKARRLFAELVQRFPKASEAAAARRSLAKLKSM